MSRSPIAFALAVGLAVGALVTQAAAQGVPPACTQPLDPACNHLKCYQIKDKPITVSLQVDNQFGREKLVTLQPVLLCLPSQKSCCNTAGCSTANCPPNPVPAPGLPHLKCYKIKNKLTQCAAADPTCTTATGFPRKTIQVNLHDQFGTEGPIPILAPRLFCAPVDKQVVGASTTTSTQRPPTTTTTTSTTTTTTTTIQFCHNDATSLTGCSGPCPPTAPAGAQCQLANGKCGCVLPPVCCECSNTSGAFCLNTNNPCPTGCNTVANATCNTATAHCDCGLCRSPGAPCSTIPCSTSQPCPNGMFCDAIQCPAPCDPCGSQTGSCNPVPCLRSDGTNSQCRLSGPVPGQTCNCCSSQPGSFCSSNTDCCPPLTCNSAGACN
jgi:hypothetical protein